MQICEFYNPFVNFVYNLNIFFKAFIRKGEIVDMITQLMSRVHTGISSSPLLQFAMLHKITQYYIISVKQIYHKILYMILANSCW